MAKLKKSAVKKLTKASKGSSKPLGLASKVGGAVAGKLGMKVAGKGGFKGGRRRAKKSAMWYAKEIARLKLKKRYEKVRLRI